MIKLLPFLVCLFSGCGPLGAVAGVIDQYGFSFFGYTAFSAPGEVSLKEIHLDTGGLKGKEVVVEGNLLEVGDFSTYAILGDESARMLVILTKVSSGKDLISFRGKSATIRVLGTISGGQLGLPYVDARAIVVVPGLGADAKVKG